ncbi:cell division protein PerM [Arcanobacterium canis]
MMESSAVLSERTAMDDELTPFQRAMIVTRGALVPSALVWCVLTLAILVFYVVDAEAPALGEATWIDATRFASGFFLTAFGGSVRVGTGSLTLAPLTITAMVVGFTYLSLRRRGVLNWREWAVATFSPTVLVGMLGLIVQPGGPWWVAIIGNVLWFGCVTIVAGRESLVPNAYGEIVTNIVKVLRLLVTTMAIFSLLIFVAGVIGGATRIAAIQSSYIGGMLDAVGLTLLQLAYLPNALIWGFAYLTGAGFAVGQGTSFSVLSVTSLPLPAVPAFGALPQVGWHAPWLIAVLVSSVAILGIWRARKDPHRSLATATLHNALGGVMSALIMSALTGAASGAIGAGRMSVVGANGTLVFGLVLIEVALPFLLASVIAHRATLSWTKGQATTAYTRTKDKISAAEEKLKKQQHNVPSKENPDLSGDSKESQDTLDTHEIPIVTDDSFTKEADKTK